MKYIEPPTRKRPSLPSPKRGGGDILIRIILGIIAVIVVISISGK